MLPRFRTVKRGLRPCADSTSPGQQVNWRSSRRPKLQEALKKASDPEVTRRIEEITQEMDSM
jgi:hypothetical protein